MSRRKREGKPYQLISEELPVLERAVRTSEYDELLDEFVKGSLHTARVEYPDKSMKALMAALRSRIKKRNLEVKVALRKGNLYLTKA
jgi:ribosomal protein L10